MTDRPDREQIAATLWNSLPSTPYGWGLVDDEGRSTWLTMADAVLRLFRPDAPTPTPADCPERRHRAVDCPSASVCRFAQTVPPTPADEDREALDILASRIADDHWLTNHEGTHCVGCGWRPTDKASRFEDVGHMVRRHAARAALASRSSAPTVTAEQVWDEAYRAGLNDARDHALGLTAGRPNPYGDGDL